MPSLRSKESFEQIGGGLTAGIINDRNRREGTKKRPVRLQRCGEHIPHRGIRSGILRLMETGRESQVRRADAGILGANGGGRKSDAEAKEGNDDKSPARAGESMKASVLTAVTPFGNRLLGK